MAWFLQPFFSLIIWGQSIKTSHVINLPKQRNCRYDRLTSIGWLRWRRATRWSGADTVPVGTFAARPSDYYNVRFRGFLHYCCCWNWNWHGYWWTHRHWFVCSNLLGLVAQSLDWFVRRPDTGAQQLESSTASSLKRNLTHWFPLTQCAFI